MFVNWLFVTCNMFFHWKFLFILVWCLGQSPETHRRMPQVCSAQTLHSFNQDLSSKISLSPKHGVGFLGKRPFLPSPVCWNSRGYFSCAAPIRGKSWLASRVPSGGNKASGWAVALATAAVGAVGGRVQFVLGWWGWGEAKGGRATSAVALTPFVPRERTGLQECAPKSWDESGEFPIVCLSPGSSGLKLVLWKDSGTLTNQEGLLWKEWVILTTQISLGRWCASG